MSRMAYQVASRCLVPNTTACFSRSIDAKRERYSFASAQSSLPINAASNSPKKKKNEHDHQDEAKTAGGIVSPPATVGPRRKCADEQHNEYDEQYGAEWHWSSPLGSVRLQRSPGERIADSDKLSFLTADQSGKFPRLNSAMG